VEKLIRVPELFHGDLTNQTVIIPPQQLERTARLITDIKHNDVRTEGLSYG